MLGNLAAVLLAAIALALAAQPKRVDRGLALLVFCLPLVATGPILRVLFGPGTGAADHARRAGGLLHHPGAAARRAARGAGGLVRPGAQLRPRAVSPQLCHVRARRRCPISSPGLQIAAPAAFLGAMVGEFTGAERGMGVLTIRAMRALDVRRDLGAGRLAAAAGDLGLRRHRPDRPRGADGAAAGDPRRRRDPPAPGARRRRRPVLRRSACWLGALVGGHGAAPA